MSRCKINIRVQLILEAPLHTGVGYGLAGFLDARTLLDAQGYPYIAGSTLKGRLRYYLRGLLPALDAAGNGDQVLARLFGAREQAGALTFTDLRLSDGWLRLFQQMAARGERIDDLLTQQRTNVMLSRLRGVALEQHLFTVETAPAHFTFTGEIFGYLALDASKAQTTLKINGADCPRDLALLIAASRALTHMGGRKSRGVSRCRLEIQPEGLRINGEAVAWQQLLEALK
ncbi:MAG: hypothetical protein DYG89_41380 [Caldilinea sp. CFX5]|nr:hypothetical protein [Caldilinea sp. CFX5]